MSEGEVGGKNERCLEEVVKVGLERECKLRSFDGVRGRVSD